MAFGFRTSGNAMTGAAPGPGGASEGPELELIQTEALGFKSIAGDAKLRLTTPWSSPPPDTASLITIAARKGLVAAAGPDGITIATTDAVRKGFDGDREGDSDIRNFEPQLKLPLPMRVSHIAFTADETYLILSAESGGGLAVYDTQSLLQGNSQAAFELPTNGESLRALVPNPTAEKAGLCAIVTNNGNLHMASLKEKQISSPLKSQVSCISWSTRGKQLLAGLADGTIHQMTPEGEAKGEIPSPPSVTNAHVASLSWLENHVILSIHTNTNESPPSSTYHIITRQPPSTFTFQKMIDPVDPFGAEKAPHHSIMRLKDFPPNLQDLLIIASTASPDIGLISRSKAPLSPDKPADSISNVFTTTELLDDSKRAQLPMSDSMDNTIPIGVALDLSSKNKVYKPLPADEEIEESPGPLPGYWVLNNEGVLSSWWIVYEDSVRQGTTYPGLAALDDSAQTATPAPAPAAAAPAAAPAFGSSTGTSAFGSTPAFGSSAALGAKPSPWGTSQNTTGSSGGQPSTAFGSSSFGSAPAASSPAFGKPSSLGFGQSSQIGTKTSPWGTAGSTASSTSSTPAFGQSGFGALGGAAGKSVFGSSTNSKPASVPTSGGFASFAGSSGFAAAGANTSGSSIFSSKPASGSPFGSAAQTSTDTAFPPPKSDGSGLGFNTTGSFKLESSFKPDPKADDNEKPASSGGSSLFGSNFGAALEDAAQQTSKDENMDTSTTPQPTQSKSPFSLGSAPSTTESKSPFGLFGSQSKSPFDSTPDSSQATETKAPAPFDSTTQSDQTTPDAKPKSLFGSTETTPQAKSPFALGGTQGSQLTSPFSLNGLQSTTPTTTPAPNRFDFKTTSDTPQSNIFGSAPSKPGSLFKTAEPTKPATEAKQPEIKVESPGEATLPPESATRAVFSLGESSSSGTWTDLGSKASKLDDAPLPPDFIKPAKPAQTKASPSHPEAVATPKPSTFSGSIFSSLSEKKQPSSTPSQPFSFPSITQDAYSDSSDEGSTDGSLGVEAPLPPDFVKKTPVKEAPRVPAVPDSDGESNVEEEAGDVESEGSGVLVGKDISPSTTGFAATPGYTPQSSFGGISGSTFIIPPAQSDKPRNSLFGELGKAQVLPRPTATSPRSPSPVRGAIPGRLAQPSVASRSVSAPGMASQILGASRRSGAQMGLSTVANRLEEDPQLKQQREARSRREAEETKVLEDEDDDEIQKILASDIEPTLELDDFIAHTNVIPSSQETIPAQVEVVYRDINSMIDMLGLNARSVAAFMQGHSDNYKEGGRCKDDLEDPDDWVLCEVDELGEVLDTELAQELENGRVQDVEEKLEACRDLAREMSRLRSKQEDLKKLITIRLDPDQAEVSRSLPLSAEQTSQQNELRREYGKFMRQLTEAEETLTLLKTKLASIKATSSKSTANVPTVEAVMRTINKMTSMAEKRSGDIDVLENQLRKLRVSPINGREGSPAVMTPQRKANNRSVVFSPESAAGGSPRASTTSYNPRNSLMSASVMSAGGAHNTTPRKTVSGFSRAEKVDLMEKRAKRRTVLDKLKANVQNNGVQPWPMPEDSV